MWTEPLSILSFGAGAIGTYIGGSLALAGDRVVFLEQESAAAGLRERGLCLNIGGIEYQVDQPLVMTSLAETLAFGRFDFALFALKSNDTRRALEQIAPLKGKMPPVLCLQNGVENEAALSEVLGPDKVIPATVTSAVGRRFVGDIILQRKRGIGVADGHPLSKTVFDALVHAGLNAHLYPIATDMKWSKMITNLLGNATSAILDMTPAEIFDDPRLLRLEVEQIREMLRVMGALGIHVTDLPGVPARLLAFGLTKVPLALARPLLRKAIGGGRGAKMPSFHIDLHSGKGQTEADYLNGAVVRFGEKAGVPTPVNRALNETLLKMTRGEIALDEFRRNPDKLLMLVDR